MRTHCLREPLKCYCHICFTASPESVPGSKFPKDAALFPVIVPVVTTLESIVRVTAHSILQPSSFLLAVFVFFLPFATDPFSSFSLILVPGLHSLPVSLPLFVKIILLPN